MCQMATKDRVCFFFSEWIEIFRGSSLKTVSLFSIKKAKGLRNAPRTLFIWSKSVEHMSSCSCIWWLVMNQVGIGRCRRWAARRRRATPPAPASRAACRRRRRRRCWTRWTRPRRPSPFKRFGFFFSFLFVNRQKKKKKELVSWELRKLPKTVFHVWPIDSILRALEVSI